MKQYCESPFHYKRIRSKAVQVGDLSIGDLQPIRIQSMTTTNTDDIEATVNQTKALADAGCEIVRITAPNIKSAENLEQIVNQLRRDNYTVPIVADIHFTPNAALKAAEFVEKVRVNPGNYADKKKFAVIEYTDQAYSDELAKIEEKFTPLVEKLKQYKRALRIGTNHGSLSDRIMNRYGDTALGMVESAWEFAEICIKNDFHNFVFSMKASNPEVMIQAYRLLQNRMLLENKIYPLHLGVTEAGDGQDGRIKSMVGICSLLEDGIGDTIRVSLTESPLKEVPVARYIADHYNHKQAEEIHIVRDERRNPFQFTKRESVQVQSIGNQQVAQVILDISHHNLNANLESALRSKQKADSLIVKAEQIDPVRQIDDRINLIVRVDGINRTGLKQVIVSDYDLIEDQLKSASLVIFELKMGLLTKDMIDELEKMKLPEQVILTITGEASVAKYRILADLFPNNPILISSPWSIIDNESFLLQYSTLCGSLLCDGIGDGLILSSTNSPAFQLQAAFDMLQACRVRLSKTEFISCPSCGRTLFDLEETTAKVKAKTGHLKGLKIAVMGCIVNGPGEMADADFGYVGAGPGKINLYVGKELVKRNIQSSQAVDELVSLIKQEDKWVEAEHE